MKKKKMRIISPLRLRACEKSPWGCHRAGEPLCWGRLWVPHSQGAREGVILEPCRKLPLAWPPRGHCAFQAALKMGCREAEWGGAGSHCSAPTPPPAHRAACDLGISYTRDSDPLRQEAELCVEHLPLGGSSSERARADGRPEWAVRAMRLKTC